jgi:hypothetical protein
MVLCVLLYLSWDDLFNIAWLRRLSLALTVAFIALSLFASPLLAEPGMQSVWKITYQHSYYHLSKAVLSQSRASFTTGIYTFALLPPDYRELYIVNPAAHLYLETPDNKWWRPGWLLENIYPKYVRAGGENIAGLKCAHYLCLDKQGQTRAEFWTTKEIPAKAELADAFCKICGVPTGLGVPVRYVVASPGSRQMVKQVEAVSITKDIVSIDTFLPASFKRAQDRYALFVSQSGVIQKSDIEDLFTTHDKKKLK